MIIFIKPIFIILLFFSAHSHAVTPAPLPNPTVTTAEILGSILASMHPISVGYVRLQAASMPPDTEHTFLIDAWNEHAKNNAERNFKPIMEKIIEKTGIDREKVRFEFVGDYALSSEAFSSHHRIGFSDYFFELPSDEQKEFLATHEAIHYKEQHSKKVGIAAIVIPLVIILGLRACSYGVHALINHFASENTTLKTGKTLTDIMLFKNCFTHLFMMKYFIQKYCCTIEKRADIGAAQALGSAQGGISLMHHWIAMQTAYEKIISDASFVSKEINITQQQLEQLSWQERMSDALYNFFGFREHPTHEERLTYLQAWQQENSPKTPLLT